MNGKILLYSKKVINTLIIGGTQLKLNDILDMTFNDIYKIISTRKFSLEILGVSMTLFHYYSYYKSFREFDKAQLAVASIFLGCKLQGFFFNTDEAFKDYSEIRKLSQIGSFDIIKYEVELLNILGFDINIDLPYHYVNKYLDLLNISEKEKIFNISFNLINDSYRRPLCIYFTAREIALSAIYIACQIVNDNVQNNLFDKIGFEKNELNECIEIMYTLFGDTLKII